MLPTADVLFDWLACISYFVEGQIVYGSAILTVLVLGSLFVSDGCRYMQAPVSK